MSDKTFDWLDLTGVKSGLGEVGSELAAGVRELHVETTPPPPPPAPSATQPDPDPYGDDQGIVSNQDRG